LQISRRAVKRARIELVVMLLGPRELALGGA
jgi:hypothetical protein